MGRLQKNNGRKGLVSSNVVSIPGKSEIDYSNSVEMDRQLHPRDPRIQQNQKRPAAPPINPNIAMDKRMTRWEPGVDFGKLVSLFSSSKKDAKPSKAPQPEASSFSSASRPQPNRNQAGSSSSPPADIAADRKGKGVAGSGGRDGRLDPRALGPAVRSPLSRNPSFPPNGQAGHGQSSNTNYRMDNRPPIHQDGGLSPAPYAGKGKDREDSALRPAGNVARKPLVASSFAEREREAQMGQQRRQQQQQQASISALPPGARDPDGLPIRNNRDVRVPVPEIRVIEPRVSVERNPPAREQRAKVQQIATAKVVDIFPGKSVDDRRQLPWDNNNNNNNNNNNSKHGLGISAAQQASSAARQPPSSHAPVESGQRVPNRSELAVQDMPLRKDPVKTSGPSERVDYKLDTRTNRLVPVPAERPQESRPQQIQKNSSWSPFPQTHQRKISNPQSSANVIAEEQSRSKAKGKQKEEHGGRSESQQVVAQSAGVLGSEQKAASLVADQAALRRPERPAIVSRPANSPQAQPQVTKDIRGVECPPNSSMKDVDPKTQSSRQPPSASLRKPQNTQTYHTPQRDGRFPATNAEPVSSSMRPSQPQRGTVSAGREKSFAEHAGAPPPPAAAAAKESARDRSAGRELPPKQPATREEHKRSMSSASLAPAATSAKIASRDGNEEQGFLSRLVGSKDQQGLAASSSSQNAAYSANLPEKTGAPMTPQRTVEAPVLVDSEPLSEKSRSAPGSQKSPPTNEQGNRLVQGQTRSENKAREPVDVQAQYGISRDKNLGDNGGQRNDVAFRQARERPRVEIPQSSRNPYQAFKPFTSVSDRQGASIKTNNSGSSASREGRRAQTPEVLREDSTRQDSPKPLSLGTRDALAQMLRKESGSPRAGRGSQQADSPLDDRKRYQAFSPVGTARPSLPDQRVAAPTRKVGALSAGPEKERYETAQNGNREQGAPKLFGVDKNATLLGQMDSRTRGTEAQINVLPPVPQQRSDSQVAVGQQSYKPSRDRTSDPNKQEAPIPSMAREAVPRREVSRDARLPQADYHQPDETEQRSDLPGILATGRPRGEQAVDARSPQKTVQSKSNGSGPAPGSQSRGVKEKSASWRDTGAMSSRTNPEPNGEFTVSRAAGPPALQSSLLDQEQQPPRLDGRPPHEEKSFDIARKTTSAVPAAVPTSVERPPRTTPPGVYGRGAPAAETFAIKDKSRAPVATSYSDSATRVAPQQVSTENAEKGQPLHVRTESRKRSSQGDDSAPIQRDLDTARLPPNGEKQKGRGLVDFSPAVLEQQPAKEVTIRAPPRSQQTVLVAKGASQDATAPLGSSASMREQMAAAAAAASRASIVPDAVQVPWSERYLPTEPQRSAGAWKADDDSTSVTPVASHKRGFWDLYSGSSSREKTMEGSNVIATAPSPWVKPERPAAPAAALDWRPQKPAVSNDHSAPTQQGIAAPSYPFGLVQGDNAIPDCLLVPSPTRTSPPAPLVRKAAGSGVTREPVEKGLILSSGVGEQQKTLRKESVAPLVPVMDDDKVASATATATAETAETTKPVLPFSTHADQKNTSATFDPVNEQQPDPHSYLNQHVPTASSTSFVPSAANPVPVNNVTVTGTAAIPGLADGFKPTDAKSRRKSNRMASMYGAQLNPGYNMPMPPIMFNGDRPQPPLSRPSDLDIFGTREPAVVPDTGAFDLPLTRQTGTPEIRLEEQKMDGLQVPDNSSPLLPPPSTPTGQKFGRPATPKPSRTAHGSFLATDAIPPIPGIDVFEPLRKSQLPAPLSLKMSDAKEASNDPLPTFSSASPAVMEPKTSSSAEVDRDSRETQYGFANSVSDGREESPRGPYTVSSAPPPQPATGSRPRNFLGDIFKNKENDRTDDVSLFDGHKIASLVSEYVESDAEAVKRHDGKRAEISGRSTTTTDSRTLSFSADETVVGQQDKAEETLDARPSFWNRLEPTTQLHRGTGKDEDAISDLDPEPVQEAGSLSFGAEQKNEEHSKGVMNALEPCVTDSADKVPSSLESYNSSNTFATSDSARSTLGTSSEMPGADQDERSGTPQVGGQKTSTPVTFSMKISEMTVDSTEALPGKGESGHITPAPVTVSRLTAPSTYPDGLDSTGEVEVREPERDMTPSFINKADRAVPSSPSTSHVLVTPSKTDGVEAPCRKEEGHDVHIPLLKSSPAAPDTVSKPEFDVTTEHQSDNDSSVTIPAGFGKDMEAQGDSTPRSPPANPEHLALQTPLQKELLVSSRSSLDCDSKDPSSTKDQSEVPHSSDASHISVAAVETSRSVDEPELLPPSASGSRPVSSIFDSTKQPAYTPAPSGPEDITISPAHHEDSFSLTHNGDARPGDEAPVLQSNSVSGRELLSHRQSIDTTTTFSLSSLRSSSPPSSPSALQIRTIDATGKEGIENGELTKPALDLQSEWHSPLDESDSVKFHHDGKFQSETGCSANSSHILATSAPISTDGKDASVLPERTGHDIAAAQHPSSTDITDSEPTLVDHLSRDTVQTVQSSDEDTATEPLSSNPRSQHRVPSNDAMSARTSVNSISVVICPSRSIVDEDRTHTPTVVDRQNSEEEPFVYEPHHLSEDLSPSPDQDDRMAHWLRDVHSPEPSEGHRPESTVDSEGDHNAHTIQSWLHRVSTPAEESRTASPDNGLDLESHRAIASRSPDNHFVAEQSQAPSPLSDVSSDNRDVAASDLGTDPFIFDRSVSRDEAGAQASRAPDHESVYGDSCRQSMVEPEASGSESSLRRKSCLVDTDASSLKQKDAAEGTGCVSDNDEPQVTEEQSPTMHNDHVDDYLSQPGPAQSFEEQEMEDKVTEHVYEETASTPVERQNFQKPVDDAPIQNANDSGDENHLSVDGHLPRAEEEFHMSSEPGEGHEGLGVHGDSDAAEKESLGRALDDDHVYDAGGADLANNESIRDDNPDSVDPSTPPTMSSAEEEQQDPPLGQKAVEDSKPGAIEEETHVPSESHPLQEEGGEPAPVGPDEAFEKFDGIEDNHSQEESPDAATPSAHAGPDDDDDDGNASSGEDAAHATDDNPEEGIHNDADIRDLDGSDVPGPEDGIPEPDQELENDQHDVDEELDGKNQEGEMITGGEEEGREIEDMEEEASVSSHEGLEGGDGVDSGPEDVILDGLVHESEAPAELDPECSENEHESEREQVDGDRGFDPELEVVPNADEHEQDGFGAEAIEDEDESRDLDGLGNGQDYDDILPGADVDSQHDHTPEYVDNGEEDLGVGGDVSRDLDMISGGEVDADEPGEERQSSLSDGELEIHEAQDLDDSDGAAEDEIFSDGEDLAEEENRELPVESDHQEDEEVPSEHEDGIQDGEEDFLDNYNYSDTEEHQEPDLIEEETSDHESITSDETSQEEEDREPVDMDDLYAVDIPSVPASPIEVQEEPAAVVNTDPVRLSMIYAQAPDFLSLDSPVSPTGPSAQAEASGDGGAEEEQEDLVQRDPVRFSCIYRQSVDWEQALSSPVLRDLRSPTPEPAEEEEDSSSSSSAVPIFSDPVPPGSSKRTTCLLSPIMLATVPEQMTPVAAAAVSSPLSPWPPGTPPADHAEQEDKPLEMHSPHPLSAREQPTPPPEAEYVAGIHTNDDDHDDQDWRGGGSVAAGCPRTFDEMNLAVRRAGPGSGPLPAEGDDADAPRTAGSSIDLRALDGHRRSLSRRLSGWWSGSGSGGDAAGAGPSRARTPPPPLPYNSRFGEEPASPF